MVRVLRRRRRELQLLRSAIEEPRYSVVAALGLIVEYGVASLFCAPALSLIGENEQSLSPMSDTRDREIYLLRNLSPLYPAHENSEIYHQFSYSQKLSLTVKVRELCE